MGCGAPISVLELTKKKNELDEPSMSLVRLAPMRQIVAGMVVNSNGDVIVV